MKFMCLAKPSRSKACPYTSSSVFRSMSKISSLLLASHSKELENMIVLSGSRESVWMLTRDRG